MADIEQELVTGATVCDGRAAGGARRYPECRPWSSDDGCCKLMTTGQLPAHSDEVCWFRGTQQCDAPASRQGLVLLPGSFNPLHHGHVRLRETVCRLLQRDVIFELSTVNVDKPPLTIADIQQRLQQFGDAPVAVTRAPRFDLKAALFRAATFVVGMDTAERLLQLRYAGGSETVLSRRLQQMQNCGVTFLVAGRQDAAGEFRTLDSLEIPAEFRVMFRAIPGEEFREDISSSELRLQQSRNGRHPGQ